MSDEKAIPTGQADPEPRNTGHALVNALGRYRALAKLYGLQQFILPRSPEQNGVAESFMGAHKLERVWQHRFETYDKAKGDHAWVTHYNESRPHSRLDYLPPAEWRSRQAELSA